MVLAKERWDRWHEEGNLEVVKVHKYKIPGYWTEEVEAVGMNNQPKHGRRQKWEHIYSLAHYMRWEVN